MINASDIFKQNITQFGKEIAVRIIYDDIIIVNKDIKSLTLAKKDDLFKSSMRSLDIVMEGDIDLRDKDLSVDFGVSFDGSDYEYIHFGTFIPLADSIKYSYEKNETSMTCYDQLILTHVPYDLNITIPSNGITVDTLLKAICSFFSFSFNDDTYVNKSSIISKENYSLLLSMNPTYRDVLDYIAQITASLIIVEDDILKLVYPHQSEFVFDGSNLKTLAVSDRLGPFNRVSFTKIENKNITNEDGDITEEEQEVTYYREDITSIQDNGKSEITFTNNPLMSDHFLQGIFNKVKGLMYYSYDISSFGFCYFSPLDIITIQYAGKEYTSMIMSDVITINNGLNESLYAEKESSSADNYTSTSSSEKSVNYSSAIHKEIYSEKFKGIAAEFQNVNTDILEVNKELIALSGKIDNLDVGNLEATYAKIDMSNVSVESVGKLFVDSGLLKDVIIVDGHVTGDLTGVRIHGDLIDANTLKVKNLLLEGPDGLIYQINALASGLTQTELTEEIYNQKMLGSVLVNQSVTTEQLNTKEIFSNSAVIAQIFAQDVTATGTVTGMTFKGGSININEKFIVDSLGNMKSINGEFSGKIDALSGTIGGWKISENKLLSKNENTTSNGSREEKTTTIDSLLNEIIFQYKSYYDDEIDTLLETLISHDGISWKSEYYSNGLATLSYLASLSSDSLRLQDSAHGNYAILTMDRLRLVQNETSLVDIGNSNGNAKFLGGVYTNNKTGATDGKVGGALGTNGYLHLVADKSRNNPGISFYYDMATSATHQLTARQNDFYFNRPVTVNGTIRINNSTVLGTYNSKGTAGNLIYCSNDDRVIIGTSSTDVYGNMDIYSGDFMKFHASSNSVSYKATALEFFREQSDSHRTILRPASNSGAYLGTTTYRWNTAFFTNNITASDLKEKEVIEDFDFKVKDFIMGLDPIAYRRKGQGDTGERIHIGLGAQTLAKHIKDLNLGNLSMVQASIVDGESEKSYHGEDIDDELLLWGINYTELTPYLILMLKEQQNEINSLKKEIDEIKKMILKQEDK